MKRMVAKYIESTLPGTAGVTKLGFFIAFTVGCSRGTKVTGSHKLPGEEGGEGASSGRQ